MEKSRYSLRGWSKAEYIDFGISIGIVFGAFLTTLVFTIAAIIKHIQIPQEVLAIPIGFGAFISAYFFDAIAHRSVYKDQIDKDELIIHHLMVYGSSFPLFISLVLAYWWPHLMMPFIACFVFLKTMYSLGDEFLFHWPRYKQKRSDLIEMSAHAVQFASNVLFDVGWIYL